MTTFLESTPASHQSRWLRHSVVTLSAVAMMFALMTFSSTVLRGKSAQPVVAARNQPMRLLEVEKSLPPDSWQVIPFNLPYSGLLNVHVGVVDGRPMNVFVTTPQDLQTMRDNRITSVPPSPGFAPETSMSVRRAARLTAGNYLLVIEDPSIGDVSRRESRVSIHAELRP